MARFKTTTLKGLLANSIYFLRGLPMTLSNLIDCEQCSCRSFGICHEEPYTEKILARHRAEEAAVRRRIAEINEKITITRAEAL